MSTISQFRYRGIRRLSARVTRVELVRNGRVIDTCRIVYPQGRNGLGDDDVKHPFRPSPKRKGR